MIKIKQYNTNKNKMEKTKLTDLEEKLKKLEESYDKLNGEKRILQMRCSEKINQMTTDLEKIIKEMRDTNFEICLPKFSADVKKIDLENIITDEDIKIIFDGMDKCDYSVCGINGWLDTNKLVENIILIKSNQKYSDFRLKKVSKGMSQDSYPPSNSYSIEFINDNARPYIKLSIGV
jgi:hypothetical protein